MYALTRIQDKPGRWCWRVLYRRHGRECGKSFYDLKLGGPHKARAAAIAWRDAQLAQIPPLAQREHRRLARAANASGIPGVRLIRQKNQPSGSWQAWLELPDGKRRTRTFAVLKHGHEGALALAVAARAELLNELGATPASHLSAARASEARRETGGTAEAENGA